MPGLAEMHAHVPPANAPAAVTDRVSSLYVVNGITTIRGMLGDASHLALRAKLANGEKLGPRLVTSGPSFNNDSVRTPQAGIDSVLSQKRAGYDLLKIHPGVSRETFDSVAATANRVGIPFSGHVPFEVGYPRALTSKYSTIDHADGLLEAMLRDGATVRPEQGGFFGLGLVATGKAADLILLQGNPLADIRNTARIEAVMGLTRFRGRLTRPNIWVEVSDDSKQEDSSSREA